MTTALDTHPERATPAPAVRLLALVVTMALLTWLLGWWATAAVGFVAGALWWRPSATPWLAALGATLAWGALLLADMVGGRFGSLASSLANVMKLPAAALIVVTLLFSALLAWGAAVVGSELARLLARRSTPDD